MIPNGIAKLAGAAVTLLGLVGGATFGAARLAVGGVEAQIVAHAGDGTIHPEAARRIASLADDLRRIEDEQRAGRDEAREATYQVQRKLDALLVELYGKLPRGLPPAADFAPVHMPDGGTGDAR